MKENLVDFLPIIGLEVHVELRTLSKMFCGCSAKHFQVEPNTHTCPVCLGLPGALPVPNQKAIDWCLLIGLALNCEIPNEAKFDRKNYFYPDLPKGYQISQYDQPFCKNGWLKIRLPNQEEKIIRINRVHLEEDTAKLLHVTLNGERVTLIDFNRSGVPLVEIVSEPDLQNAQEAVSYLKKIQQIIRYLGVSDCDMEKGSMRLEVNISLKQRPDILKNKQLLPAYKVEVKNINSFKFVAKAIDYEIQRQQKILAEGQTPSQETRGFDEKTGKTYSQRLKEEAHDYRYFPEPDIPPFIALKERIKKLKKTLPELPDEKVKRLMKHYKINEYNASLLCTDKKIADYFEKTIELYYKKKLSERKNFENFAMKLANLIVNKKVDINTFSPEQLIKNLITNQREQLPEKEMEKIVKEVLQENPKAVADYKKGKKAVIGFLIGQVKRRLQNKGDPLSLKRIMEKLL